MKGMLRETEKTARADAFHRHALERSSRARHQPTCLSAYGRAFSQLGLRIRLVNPGTREFVMARQPNANSTGNSTCEFMLLQARHYTESFTRLQIPTSFPKPLNPALAKMTF